MKLSIWSSYYRDLSPEDAILEFEKNGIRYCELSDEHGLELVKRGDVKNTGKAFGKFASEHNVSVEQGHLWLDCKVCTEENAVEILKTWLDLFEAIGIKSAVLHCDPMVSAENLSEKEKLDVNAEKMKILADYIEGHSITICLENMRIATRSVDDLLYVPDKVNSKNFGICLDTGHLNCAGDADPVRFIRKAADKLKALHIADNDRSADQHIMPFGRGNVDFVAVFRMLKEIGYDGLYNYEIPGESHCPPEIREYKLQYIKKCFEYLCSKC